MTTPSDADKGYPCKDCDATFETWARLMLHDCREYQRYRDAAQPASKERE